MTLPRHARAGVTLVAAIVAAAVIVRLGPLLYLGIAPRPAVGETAFTLVIFGALLGVAAVGITIDRGWPALAGRGPAAATAGAGFAIGLLGLCCTAGYACLAGETRHGMGAHGVGALLLGTMLVVFQSATEEVYFRGWLQPVLVRAWGPAVGLGVTAATFAALHIAGGERSLVTMLNLLLGGAMFGLLALRSGGLVLPVAAHIGWNWGEELLLGLVPNPGTGGYGAIVDIDMVGSPLWGGSTEGLNASLGMSFVLVAILLPLAIWRGRVSRSGAPG